jgi:fructokinase
MVLAVGTADGHIEEEVSMPTVEPERVVPEMAKWFADKKVDAIGIGAFGPTVVNPNNPDFGKICFTPKPGWSYYDFLGNMKAGCDVPMGYDTDVNVACLGEATFGCAKGLDSVCYFTVGTGIGAGVMVGGQLLHGMLHPEAGHILLNKLPYDPGNSVCPKHTSCFEGLASGPSIEARWGAKAIDLADRDEVWELEADYIAQAIEIYVTCYSPEKVIIGGGVAHQEQIFPMIRKKFLTYLNGYLSTKELDDIDNYIVPNSLNEKQGILGCLELGRRALEA